MNLWDTPDSWLSGNLNSNMDGIDTGTEKRGKSAVNLRTVNKYYLKRNTPLRTYVGNRTNINNIMSSSNLASTYGFSAGQLGYIIHQPAGTGSVNNPANQALVNYNDQVDQLCNVGNGYQQLIFSTAFYTNLLVNDKTAYPSGDSKDSQIMWYGLINKVNVTPINRPNFSIAWNGWGAGQTPDLSDLGWNHTYTPALSPGGTSNESSGRVSFNLNSDQGGSQDYLEFYTTASTQAIYHEWNNDRLFYACSTYISGIYANLESHSHIMPQKNMSGCILSAFVKCKNYNNRLGIDFIDTGSGNNNYDDYTVDFVLCGVKHQVGSGTSLIRELCSLASLAGNTDWGRTTGGSSISDGENELAIFYPNENGSHTKTGQFSDAMFIGENRTVDERFDALRIRVKVRMKTYAGGQPQPKIRIYADAMPQVGYNFYPILRTTN